MPTYLELIVQIFERFSSEEKVWTIEVTKSEKKTQFLFYVVRSYYLRIFLDILRSTQIWKKNLFA